ncbi:Holliday junction resolvase RuvX [Bifidobacterium indicum]|uniref:Holliday junction resolvase RuvX n=1 Tax=Bifidobacterium indicum TaxID=1691 RepID=UPI0030DB8670
MSAPIWMGIDLGQARVGVALCDPELTLAYPAGKIEVQGDCFRALGPVVDLIHEHGVERVIVGYPLLLNGSEGGSAKKAKRWVRNLSRILNEEAALAKDSPVRVLLQDERLTTVSAHHQLYEAQIGGRGHKPLVDQQSAVVLLQSALDEYKVSKER